MAKYLLIESRDPFDSHDSEYFAELTKGIASRDNQTVLFLVQNGVMPARKGSKHSKVIRQLLKSKVKILADKFSLKERAIGDPLAGVEVAEIDKLVDFMLEPGTKTIWH